MIWPLFYKTIIQSLMLEVLCLYTAKCTWYMYCTFQCKKFHLLVSQFQPIYNPYQNPDIHINTAITRSVKHIFSCMLHVFILSSWLFFSRRCEWVAFLYVFGYLFFFRTCTYFGFEKPPEHSNAIQLLVTLRVSYELNKFDFGHPCYGQLTAVKTSYLLTR